MKWLMAVWRKSIRRARCQHRIVVGGVCLHCDTPLDEMMW